MARPPAANPTQRSIERTHHLAPDEFTSICHTGPCRCHSAIFPENRYPRFGIMRGRRSVGDPSPSRSRHCLRQHVVNCRATLLHYRPCIGRAGIAAARNGEANDGVAISGPERIPFGRNWNSLFLLFAGRIFFAASRFPLRRKML